MLAIADLGTLRLVPGRPKQSRLGGAAGTSSDVVAAITIYDDLPRPAKLPPPNFGVNTRNEAAKIAFQKIWDGDNVNLNWCLTRGVNRPTRLQVSVNIIAGDDDGGDFYGRNLMVVTIQEQNNYQIGYAHEPIDQEFGEALPNATLGKLAHRMVYYVVRAHGVRLHSHEPQMTSILCTVFSRIFREDFAMILDIRILVADMMKSTMPNNHVAIGQKEELIADALVSRDKLEEAAKLYQLVSETHFPPATRGHHLRVLIRWGLCLIRTRQLQRAEEVSLRSLYLYQEFCRSSPSPNEFEGSFQSFDLHSSEAFNIIWQLLDAATALHELDRQGTGTLQLSDTNSGEPEVYIVFFSLLYVAGYHLNGFNGKPHPSVSGIGNANARSVLKRAYQNSRHNALDAIKRASANPDKDHFYRVVRSCAQPGSRFQLFSPENRKSTKVLRREAKQQSQETVSGCSYLQCSRLSSVGVTMMLCKCKAVAYCDKTCQRSDWKEHKHICSYHLEKKEAKTEAAASRN